MSVLKNQRHELFAQALAKGASQVDAYEQAGYQPSRSAAARLAADVSICERVAELAERAAARTEVTAAAITARLLNIADVAEKTGIARDDEGNVMGSSSKHLTVARASLMDAAKLNGLVVEKSQLTGADGGPIKSSVEVVFVEPGEKSE